MLLKPLRLPLLLSRMKTYVHFSILESLALVMRGPIKSVFLCPLTMMYTACDPAVQSN